MKYRAGNRIKLKLFSIEYAGDARSGNPAPQVACFTHCAISLLFRRRVLPASCGCALQIFPEAMADNILVIDRRGRLCAASVRRTVGEAHRLHAKSVRKNCGGVAHLMRATPQRKSVLALLRERVARIDAAIGRRAGGGGLALLIA